MSDPLARAREASQGFRTQADVSFMFDTYAALLDVVEAARVVKNRMVRESPEEEAAWEALREALATLEARIKETEGES